MRFKSHSAKEAFYRKRKNARRGIKIQPSLTKGNRDLLQACREAIRDYEDSELQNPPDFVMANIHGKIQMKMKFKSHNRLFFDITSTQRLHEIISDCNLRNPNSDRRDRSLSLGYSDFIDILPLD